MKMGHIISKLRYEKGYSQQELADKLGISKGAVGMWETDKRKPDYEVLIKIADLFNVTTDFLLSHKTRNETIKNVQNIDPLTNKMLTSFEMLDEDNKDILLGEAKKMLKQQRLEEKRAALTQKAK